MKFSITPAISNFLKRKLEPKKRGLYVCLHGKYIGKQFIFINKENNLYNFIVTPDLQNLSLTFDNFKNGMDNYIISFVQIMQKKYWKIFEQQFLKNKIDK